MVAANLRQLATSEPSAARPTSVISQNRARRYFSDVRQSLVIRPRCSSHCRAGYRDPWFTSRVPSEISGIRCPIPHPCVGASESVLRTSSSMEPRSASDCVGGGRVGL
jgi:hypothetical protein